MLDINLLFRETINQDREIARANTHYDQPHPTNIKPKPLKHIMEIRPGN